MGCPWLCRRGWALHCRSRVPVTSHAWPGQRPRSLRGCGRRKARWWPWGGWTRQAGPHAAQGAFEEASRDAPPRLCRPVVGSAGSDTLPTMGRGGAGAPALALHVCGAEAAVWHGGSWISQALGGFNKGLKGAALFGAAESCSLLAVGSLLAAGGSGGVGSRLLASLPGEESRRRMNALVCHPARCEAWLSPPLVPGCAPEPGPLMLSVGLTHQRSVCSAWGVRSLKALPLRQRGTHCLLAEHQQCLKSLVA